MKKSWEGDSAGGGGRKGGGPAKESASRAAIGKLRSLLPGFTPFDSASSDSQLVDAGLRGNQQAWVALIGKYQKLIYSIPIKYGGTREDAADIFQAVCLELFTELPRLRKTDNLRPWLMTVTAHKAFHWKRQRQRQAQREIEGLDEGQLREIAPLPALVREVEREQMVRDAIARLSQRCREMIRMLFYEQPALPYAEVARHLGLATGSIGFIRGRCLKQLGQLLEELGF